jgi:hypothetical protein
MDIIFLEILGVVFLAIAYFVLQTYTSKKSRIPTELNNPEIIPIIEKRETDTIEKVSFEDLVGEMTDKESEEDDGYDQLENHLDTDDAQIDEEVFSSNTTNTEYLKLEKEVIRLKEIVENLDKKVNQKEEKDIFSYKKLLQNPESVRQAFISSEIFKPKFDSKH